MSRQRTPAAPLDRDPRAGPPDPWQEGERQQPATTAGADADPTVLALATAIGLLALGIGPLITA